MSDERTSVTTDTNDERLTKLCTSASIESVCALKRCSAGLVKSELLYESLKTRSACERMRARLAGERKDAPALRKSQLPPSDPRDEKGLLPPHVFCFSQTCVFAGEVWQRETVREGRR